MPTQSPRAVAGFAMLSLGFFDGVLGVTWLAAHGSLNASIESLGWVLGAMGVGSAIGSMAAPSLLRHIDHLRALYFALAVQVVCMVLIGLSNTIWVFALWYGLRGLANGVAHASLNAFFAPRISARHLMNVHGGWGVGTASAGLLSGLLLGAGYPWFTVYLLGAVLTIGAMRLVWMSLKHFEGWSAVDHELSGTSTGLPWAIVVLILSGGVYVGLEQGVGNWLSALLVATEDAEVSTAALATAIFWGSLTGGRFVLTRIPGSEESILIWSSVIVILALVLAPTVPLPIQLFCYGLAGLAMAPIAPFVLTVVSRRVAVERRDHVMSVQIVAFSVGAASVPAFFGLVASNASMGAIVWGFVGAAVLLLILFWITVGSRLQGLKSC
jgi:predicted MFS family arabinose efflux permease